MSILSYDAGAKFILRVYKSLGDPFNYRWSNSYELVARVAGGMSDLTYAGEKFWGFEAALHAEAVSIDSYSVSTWVPDSVPYDPESFMVVPLTDVHGARGVLAMAALDVTLLLKRQAQTGRNGKIFLRGMLGETDIERQNTGWKLSVPGDIAGEISDAVSDNNIDGFFMGGAATLGLAMVSYQGEPGSTIARNVLSLEVGGVASLQLKRGWYNQPNRTLRAAARRAEQARRLSSAGIRV